MLFHLLSWCMLLGLVYQQTEARPPYIECISGEECGPLSCCVIGMGRFSIPTCRSLPDVGETCIPMNEPYASKNLTYPDGETVEFTNIYRISCPCLNGLSCGEDSKCFDPTEELYDNYIVDY